jgi:hypothetical protein
MTLSMPMTHFALKLVDGPRQLPVDLLGGQVAAQANAPHAQLVIALARCLDRVVISAGRSTENTIVSRVFVPCNVPVRLKVAMAFFPLRIGGTRPSVETEQRLDVARMRCLSDVVPNQRLALLTGRR